MGDPLVCSASEPLQSTQAQVCYPSDSPFQPSETSSDVSPLGKFGFDPADGFVSKAPSFLDSTQLVCKGPYKSYDDYLKQMDLASRTSKLGPYLASMPKS